MKKSSRTIRHLQRCRDLRLASKARRKNKMARDRRLQLLRNKIVRWAVSFFKLLTAFLRPKTVTEPQASPPAAALAA